MKKNATIVIIMMFITLLSIPSLTRADSLWSDQSTSLYAVKPKSFQVGDLLTILIEEQAKATQQATSSNGKRGSVLAGPGSGLLNALPQMGASWDSSYNGTGSTSRGGSLNAKITVHVKEVNPNGILVVEGRQVIKINGEEQVLTVSGMARTEDVSSDNIILSSYIASANIEYQGKGTIGETQKPGIITKIFHWLF